ncbi:MAG: hypothetical protein KIT36_01040 [Alphaproteobacteria bacterium]|nr:hypothetical protein [Alphaproteobacteria bacterium]
MLYDGNLPALAARGDCKVVFFTRAAEEDTIRQAISVRRLAETVPIEFVHFDPDSASNVYLAMSEGHYLGALACKREGAHAIIAAPDMLFADGSLRRLAEHADQGKIAVMSTGIRLLQEAALPALAHRIDAPIGCREMVALALEHLHPQMRRYFVTSRDFSTFPAVCCWDLGGKGILMRCLHLHPLMIDFSRIESVEALKEQSIDGALLGRALGNWAEIHVETDSDDIFLCSLTPANAWYSESRHEPFDIETLRHTAHGGMANALHRHFFSKAVKLHTGDLDDEWRRVEAATAWLASAIQTPPGADTWMSGVRRTLRRTVGRLARNVMERRRPP